MRNSHLFSKCASGILSFSLIMAAIPTIPVMAEELEGISDEEAYEADYVEEGDAVSEDGDVVSEDGDTDSEEAYEEVPTEEQASVFIITRYTKFDTAEDGTYIEEETREKYGSITAVPGTSLTDLGLPEELEVEGYWLADGPDYPAVLTLEDMEWKLKSDGEENTEVYSEASPEGTYVFQPDYETWLLTSEDFDGIERSDGVKELELTVTIASATEETPESQDELSADIQDVGDGTAEEAPAGDANTDEMIADDVYADEGTADSESADEIIVDSEYTDEGTADSESADEIIVDSEYTNEGTVDSESAGETTADNTYTEETSNTDVTMEDASSDTSTEEDIFANLDTTAISEDSTETSVTIISETEDAGIISLYDDGTAASETGTSSETTADSAAAAETKADSETSGESESNQSSEASAGLDAVDDAGTTSSVTGTLNFYSDANLSNLLYSVSSVTITADMALSVSDLYCGTDLSQLYVTFTDDNTGSTIPLTDSSDNSALNFSAGSLSVKMTLSDSTILTYTLTVSKAGHTSGNDATCTANAHCSVCGQEISDTALGHTWTEATCTAPKTCSVCGTTEGEALGHTSAGDATCTANAHCSVCGQEIADTALGHSWTDATCTTAKTCSRCGITEGEALGHTSADNATCTANATCSRCGAEIANTALGHNWTAATCTTPKTCSRCSATEGTSLGHDLQDDWETISESTDSEHGVQERYCHRDSCDYFESRDLNIIGNPENNSIQNLTEGANYELNTRLTFTAVGAGMSNSDPINGDVRYVPSAWSIQGTAGSWLDNYSGAFSISKSGTYTVTVTFQKQVYNSGWTSTDIADSKSVTFTVGGASSDGSDDAVRINPTTGDDTPILPFVIALAAALIVIVLVIIYKRKRK